MYIFLLFQAKNLSMNKQQFCEDCKNEYASELQKTNGAQREHYNTLMPQIFQVLLFATLSNSFLTD